MAYVISPCSCGHTAPLCERCFEDGWRYLSSTAHVRGGQWALKIARVRGNSVAWPETTERMRVIARRWAEDLTRDDRLLELFADEVIRGAADEWAKLRADPKRLRKFTPAKARRQRRY